MFVITNTVRPTFQAPSGSGKRQAVWVGVFAGYMAGNSHYPGKMANWQPGLVWASVKRQGLTTAKPEHSVRQLAIQSYSGLTTAYPVKFRFGGRQTDLIPGWQPAIQSYSFRWPANQSYSLRRPANQSYSLRRLPDQSYSLRGPANHYYCG